MTTSAAAAMPLTMRSPEEFSELRAAFKRLDFTEAEICRRLEIDSLFEFQTLREGRQTGVEIRDALDALVRLLMDEQTLGEEHTALLGPELLANMEALGVAARLPEDPPRWYATAVLYPVAGLYAASDRTFPPEGITLDLPLDVVYAAITGNTGRFVAIVPDEPCDAFLDLCAGTGIGAMLGVARGARQAWAADLGPRSVHFSDFNRRLNGFDNVTAVQGDLYEAIGDLTFDRIVAHPPYVPAKERKLLFRDGGEDGEQILARIIGGLPRHLRPGGRYCCLTLATDREGETLEQRVRRWLGPAESEFDVILVAYDYGARPAKLIDTLQRAKGRLGELGERAKMYEENKVTGAYYGTIVIERRVTAGARVTARARKAPRAGAETAEWFRRWEMQAADPAFVASLLDCHPRLATHLSLIVTHKPQAGGLLPDRFELRSSYPLLAEAHVEPWVAVLMGACNGQHCARELFFSLKAQQAIAPELTEDEFAGVLKLLFSSAFLEHERFPLPEKCENNPG